MFLRVWPSDQVTYRHLCDWKPNEYNLLPFTTSLITAYNLSDNLSYNNLQPLSWTILKQLTTSLISTYQLSYNLLHKNLPPLLQPIL